MEFDIPMYALLNPTLEILLLNATLEISYATYNMLPIISFVNVMTNIEICTLHRIKTTNLLTVKTESQ